MLSDGGMSDDSNYDEAYDLGLHDVGWFGSSFVKSVGKAASSVAKTVTKPVVSAANAVAKVPVIGNIASATYKATIGAPVTLATAVVNGGRLDKAIVSSMKTQLSGIKDIAPYAATVVSFVPGIGTGVAGAIGAASALAEGKSINDALIEGVKNAIPGGAIAKSAFSVAVGAVQGKPISEIAISALPIPDAQKKAVSTAVKLAADLAKGKSVDAALYDAALKQMPKELATAVQTGVAIAQGQNIQKTLIKKLPSLASAAVPSSVSKIVSSVSKGTALNPASLAELAKHNIAPATVLAMAKKTLPTKVIGVPMPMRSPLFQRANSLPIVSLSRIPAKLSAVPSATKAVVDAVTKNPALMASSRQLLAQGMRTNAATVNDAMKIVGARRSLLPWKSLPPHAVAFIKKYAPSAPLTALRHAHTNIGGLDSAGTAYIVEKGDGPWAIAQKLTGNGNRWKELLDYNKDKKPTIDKNVWVGEVINLPPSWQKPVAVLKPPTTTTPVPVPTAPQIAPVPDPVTQVTQAATSIVPSILQAKAILAAWGKTDGINQAGLTDYGLNPADMSTTMGPRDTMMLQSFQVWDNKTLNDGLNVSGNLDAASLQALQTWATARATGSSPSTPVVSPGLPTGPTPVVPVVEIPAGVIGGTDPTISVKPLPVQTATATPTVAAKPAGSGAPIAIGAIIGGLLFGVPGAIVGGAAGAAVS